MSKARRMAAGAVGAACWVMGRATVVRAARFALYRARLDVPNDPRSNGEYALQRWSLSLGEPGHPITVLDVGANIGRWTAEMLSAAQQAHRLDDLRMHAFEASSYTFGRLSEALDGHDVVLNRVALDECAGPAKLQIVAPGVGINSLHRPLSPAQRPVTEEDVEAVTLDGYADQNMLEHIDFIKIDTEGNDMAVLRGGRRLFAEQRITIVQFEYNHRWVGARSFLRDAFCLLEPFGYQIGKLTPCGVEVYPSWDPELETFVEGNYVAGTRWTMSQLPSVSWWKMKSIPVAGQAVPAASPLSGSDPG